MVDYTNIKETLIRLDQEYEKATDSKSPILLSKLAILELCGWIETSIDEILKNYIHNHVCSEICINLIIKIIDRNYGFHYKRNLLPLFSSVIGINNLDNILDKLPIPEQIKSLTETYTKQRNDAAHTNTIEGTTPSYFAPSKVLHDYGIIESAIKFIEKEMNLLHS